MNNEQAITLDDLAGRIREAHVEAQGAFAHALDRAMAAGDFLIEAKSQLGHGGWLPWLQSACAIPERTAQAYMRLARNRAALEEQTRNAVADLGVRGALALLTEPRADRLSPAVVAMGAVLDRFIDAFVDTYRRMAELPQVDPFANREFLTLRLNHAQERVGQLRTYLAE